MKVVLASHFEREIGALYKGIEGDFEGQSRPDQPYLVVGICTREEYVESLVSFGVDRFRAEILSLSFLNALFYEIQTD